MQDEPDTMMQADPEDQREVKVKLPVKTVLRLHYVKLTTGKTFSDVVEEALDHYLGPLQDGEMGAGPRL